MGLILRHKLAIIGLVFYWPFIFILTHIPVPGMVRTAQVSDKMMHFLAYMVLTFFLWVAISPLKKVNWLSWSAWITVGIALLYGGLDEYFQGFVGRNTSLTDFAANASGVLVCMVILTFFNLWPSGLIISGLLVYLLPNFTTGNMFAQNAVIGSLYHFLGFAGFTMVWIQFIDRYMPMREVDFKWPLAALILPMVLLALVKVTTVLLGKDIWMVDIVTAVIAIILTVGVSWPAGIFRHKVSQGRNDNTAYKW